MDYKTKYPEVRKSVKDDWWTNYDGNMRPVVFWTLTAMIGITLALIVWASRSWWYYGG